MHPSIRRRLKDFRRLQKTASLYFCTPEKIKRFPKAAKNRFALFLHSGED
ncbi:hypothetical protein [Desulfonema magnum]|uniref:Uncharacterized protein n=1 Tax=Desulfonema magnum TaxID=45655 RepID=A0A975BLF1_9BACT|nr:hypothetical protein [Desulfonema magnum]QTA87590.1 Uncharacterized protein dnm_036240 [Desulfonema magnum]